MLKNTYTWETCIIKASKYVKYVYVVIQAGR